MPNSLYMIISSPVIAKHRLIVQCKSNWMTATDVPIHGHQEGRFFHGYYDHYCFLPLYVFCGRHLLVSYLRPSNAAELLPTADVYYVWITPEINLEVALWVQAKGLPPAFAGRMAQTKKGLRREQL